MVSCRAHLKTCVWLILLITPYGQARTVTSVHITATGQTLKNVNNINEINACKKFRLTKEQVMNYFSHAYPVESDLIVNSRYSSCYAEGDLNFSDGFFGTWRLYSSGGATFVFNRGDTVTFFYEHNKWFDPNAGTYDEK